MVQWLRLFASIAEGMGLIPDQGNKIQHVAQPKGKEKKKKNESVEYDVFESQYFL